MRSARLIGVRSATGWSHPGMPCVGTKAVETKYADIAAGRVLLVGFAVRQETARRWPRTRTQLGDDACVANRGGRVAPDGLGDPAVHRGHRLLVLADELGRAVERGAGRCREGGVEQRPAQVV